MNKGVLSGVHRNSKAAVEQGIASDTLAFTPQEEEPGRVRTFCFGNKPKNRAYKNIYGAAFDGRQFIRNGESVGIALANFTKQLPIQTNYIAQVSGAAFNGTRWVVLSDNVTGAFHSTDTVSWTSVTSNFGNSHPQSIVFGNGLFVAGGYGGQLRTSTDGLTWVTRTSGFGTGSAGQINWVTFGGSRFVAAGRNGTITTSDDAITWTARTSNFGTSTIRCVAFGNNVWVAVGYGGQIRTSTDAITWVTRTSPFSSTAIAFSATFGNGAWVATAQSGVIARSTDAITWSTVASPFVNNQQVTCGFGNGVFVAATSGSQFNIIKSSIDGISWSGTSPVDEGTWISKIVFSGGTIILCAYNGAALFSDTVSRKYPPSFDFGNSGRFRLQ